LQSLPIKMVFPGHGNPFAWKELASGRQKIGEIKDNQ